MEAAAAAVATKEETVVPSIEDALKESFELGVWNQHLANQNTSGAAVQGVRFFYDAALLSPPPPQKSGGASSTIKKEKSPTLTEVLQGQAGYVTVLPEIARIDSEDGGGIIYMTLESMKTKLLGGKAWEANRKAYSSLHEKTVPVILMQRGRPRDRRFGAGDILLGLFRMEGLDEASLSCRLRLNMAETQWDHQSALRYVMDSFGGKESRGFHKRRRRELPTFSTMGGVMGDCSDTAHTGWHCKDLWIRTVQGATRSIRINAYCLGDADVLESIRRAAAPPTPIQIRIRYDVRQQGKTYGGCFEEERFRAVEVHPVLASDDDKHAMHKKELIVDAEKPETACVLIGSYNPTFNARSNQESLVAVRCPNIVRVFAERFDADWAVEEANFVRDAVGTTTTATSHLLQLAAPHQHRHPAMLEDLLGDPGSSSEHLTS